MIEKRGSIILFRSFIHALGLVRDQAPDDKIAAAPSNGIMRGNILFSLI